MTVNGVVLGHDTRIGSTDLPRVVDPGKYLDAVEYVLDPKDLESINIKVDAKGPFCQ